MFWPCWTLRSQCIPSEIWMCGLAVHDSSIIRCPCIYTYGCSCSGQPLWQLFIWNCVPISMYICIFFTHMFVLIDATLASILYVHSNMQLCNAPDDAHICVCTYKCTYIHMHAHRFARMSAHRRVARLLRGNPHCTQAQAVSIQEQMGNHPGNSGCCAGLRLPKT